VDNNQRGCIAEYLFGVECLKMGYNVSMPLLDSSIYDCVVDNGDKLFKIQIKSTIKKPDNVNHSTIHIRLNNNKRPYNKEDVDYFACYVDMFSGFFIVKNTGDMQSLRLSLNGKYKENFNNFVFE
jgi:hypothetical protein